MKEIVKRFMVYKYDELSEEAKKVAREEFLKTRKPILFTELCDEQLKYFFPESELSVQYSLNYCQGDGLNICGILHMDELLDKILNNFTSKEISFFKFVMEFSNEIYLDANLHYSYCICDRKYSLEYQTQEMEIANMRGIKYKLLDKFDELLKTYITNLCKEMEEIGYKYFYEPDEYEVEDFFENNKTLFYANGKVYEW